MHERPAQLVACDVAIVTTAFSLLVRWPLEWVLSHHTPFMTFIPAVMVSAYLGGLGPLGTRYHPFPPSAAREEQDSQVAVEPVGLPR